MQNSLKNLSKYLGFIIIGIVLVLFLYCYRTYPDFINDSKPALSDWGILPKTKILFSFMLMITCIVAAIFHYFLFRNFDIKQKSVVPISSYISFLSLFLLAVVNYNINYSIHWASTVTFFWSYAIFIVLFSIKNIRNYRGISVSGMAIFLTGIFFILFTRNRFAGYVQVETVAVILFLVWIALLNLLLLRKY
jgi:hypothetical protein